jgi:hypothetical protein
LKNVKTTGHDQIAANLIKERKRAEEGHLWTHFENIRRRCHTTGVELWHDMSN